MRSEAVTGGRVKRHELKVSPEEEFALTDAARRAGVGFIRFVRESALDMARAQRGEEDVEAAAQWRKWMAELFALRHSLWEAVLAQNRTGTNLNQIARRVNAGGDLPLEELRAYLADARAFQVFARELTARIDEVLDEVAAA